MSGARCRSLVGVLLVGAPFFAGCGGGDSVAVSTVVVTGSSTIAPLVQKIGARYEQAHPGVRIDVQTGGSSRGVADARSGLAQVGMVSRALKTEESDWTAHPIALDGVCVIVHGENPISALTDDQIRGIYRGEIANWNEVGGAEGPITVVNKAEGRSTLELFLSHFGLKGEEVKASVVIGDNEQGIKTISTNPASIGYVSIGAAEFSASEGVPVKLLPMNGVAPTTENVRNGTYPLARPLNLVSFGTVGPLARDFIAFAQSPENGDLVTGLYYVPLQ